MEPKPNINVKHFVLTTIIYSESRSEKHFRKIAKTVFMARQNLAFIDGNRKNRILDRNLSIYFLWQHNPSLELLPTKS